MFLLFSLFLFVICLLCILSISSLCLSVSVCLSLSLSLLSLYSLSLYSLSTLSLSTLSLLSLYSLSTLSLLSLSLSTPLLLAVCKHRSVGSFLTIPQTCFGCRGVIGAAGAAITSGGPCCTQCVFFPRISSISAYMVAHMHSWMLQTQYSIPVVGLEGFCGYCKNRRCKRLATPHAKPVHL